ncbi:flagellin [candidate division KSB1 bacterium]|nr:flagellin [candidate division KSB1 bacterium]
MGLRIYNNIAALNAGRNLEINDALLSKSLERLSSGLRINRAADDAAGLGISQNMRAQISGLRMGSRNASQAVNLVQTAEGAMVEIHNMLERMRELAVQASSDSVTDTDRGYLDSEYNQLSSEIDRIADATKYNGVALVNGSYSGNTVSFASAQTTADADLGVQKIELNGAAAGVFTITDASGTSIQMTDGTITQSVTIAADPGEGETITVNFSQLGITLTLNEAYDDQDLEGTIITVDAGSGGSFQIGADNDANNRITFSIGNLKATGSNLGLSGTGVSTRSAAQSALDSLDTAIGAVNGERATLGAVQNRLGYTIASSNNTAENLQASESQIRDADFALEVSLFTRNQVLVQAGTAMLAQANSTSQNVLSLLR